MMASSMPLDWEHSSVDVNRPARRKQKIWKAGLPHRHELNGMMRVCYGDEHALRCLPHLNIPLQRPSHSYHTDMPLCSRRVYPVSTLAVAGCPISISPLQHPSHPYHTRHTVV